MGNVGYAVQEANQGHLARVVGTVKKYCFRRRCCLRRCRGLQTSDPVGVGDLGQAVTPANLELKETLDAFVALGFHSVGFSPLLRSPTGSHELGSAELAAMLDGMVSCGAEFERQVAAGGRYPFANAVNAMREIHRGTHRPYPCGAGAGYLGVLWGSRSGLCR